MFFPWTAESAAKFGIPRLLFHGTSYFALSAGAAVAAHEPQSRVSSDTEPFPLPGLPHEIRLTKRQLPPSAGGGGEVDFMSEFFGRVRETNSEGYGTVVNSFYELEPDYADHFRNALGRKAWHVGPVSLANADVEDKANRGKQAAIDQDECLKWLGSRERNAVVYMCFGSGSNFGAEQLREIAVGMEASGQQFEASVYGVTVESGKVERAVRRIMSTGDQEVEDMRRRAKGLGEMARKAVEEGGSSYNDLSSLIEELKLQRVASG
ncbi:unnamed protein product [Linum tenue]|uniref:Uncharacterized protein n=1 Tax=Linum tenue TaxID=586396 RepID=A0AAV0NL02_9ROSI|nr:unnamed protein product [Linum tenue]